MRQREEILRLKTGMAMPHFLTVRVSNYFDYIISTMTRAIRNRERLVLDKSRENRSPEAMCIEDPSAHVGAQATHVRRLAEAANEVRNGIEIHDSRHRGVVGSAEPESAALCKG